MNSGENPYTYTKNKYKKSLNRLSIKQYKKLSAPLKRVYTQVEFKSYLSQKGYHSIAEFIRHLHTIERHHYSEPTKIDNDITHLEFETGYWYKLAKGQSIQKPSKIFQVNDAVGFYELFGRVHPFWNLLNRKARVQNCAFQLPDEMKKRIFKTHHFPNGLSTERFIDNLKQINPAQLNNLYATKSIDSLLALMVMCVAHQYRGGRKTSRKVEKYFYAQFLYLMVFKYDINLILELYVYIFFLLESNSLFKTSNVNKPLDVDQLFADQAFVKSLIESTESLSNKEQEKKLSQNIMTYLNKQKTHPYFHAYSK